MLSQGYTEKFKRLISIFRNDGFHSLLFQIRQYLSYNLNEKWKFVYFELVIEDFSFQKQKKDSNIEVKKATQADLNKISSDLYRHFTHIQDFDKKYISQIGEKGINCFVAIINNQIVHYFMVFENASNSPLKITPFKKGMIEESDAFLGNAFTIPKARGYWVLPQVLSEIFAYLKTNKEINRAILLAHTDTPSAIAFFDKIGFKVIKDATKQPLFIRIIRTIFYR